MFFNPRRINALATLSSYFLSIIKHPQQCVVRSVRTDSDTALLIDDGCIRRAWRPVF